MLARRLRSHDPDRLTEVEEEAYWMILKPLVGMTLTAGVGTIAAVAFGLGRTVALGSLGACTLFLLVTMGHFFMVLPFERWLTLRVLVPAVYAHHGFRLRAGFPHPPGRIDTHPRYVVAEHRRHDGRWEAWIDLWHLDAKQGWRCDGRIPESMRVGASLEEQARLREGLEREAEALTDLAASLAAAEVAPDRHGSRQIAFD